MYCAPSVSGDRNCDFAAGSSAYVDPDGRLYLYAMTHSDHAAAGASTQWTKMVEFRPRDHRDNPSTPAVEGCSALSSSWVSLVDGPLTYIDGQPMPRNKNIMFIEYLARHQRGNDGDFGYASFANAYNFSDRVQSAMFCLPPGARFRMFEHSGRGGAFYDLVGDGTLRSLSWSSAQSFSSACFLDSTGRCH